MLKGTERRPTKNVLKRFYFCREIMIASHDHEMRELSDIMYAMELRYSERETEAAHNFQSLMDELKNKVHSNQLCTHTS